MKFLSTIVVAALSIGALHAVQTEQRSVAVGDGITVSVREAGTGAPVIALHGGPGFRDYLPPDLEPLTSSFRVISYDQRGSGHSTVVTEPTLLTLVIRRRRQTAPRDSWPVRGRAPSARTGGA